MPDTTPRLALPLILPSQAQKHVTHNAALARLDTLVQLGAWSRTVASPPPAPVAGAVYIVAAGATDAWAGQDHALAAWDGSAWAFTTPEPGFRAWVQDEGALVVFDGAAWGALPLENLAGVGINATSDATNRLAVSAPATLLNHEGAGHQLKINKANPGDTAALLFQTGFSGRAELGCAGSDDFSLKVSADGSTWSEALAAETSTGLCRAPAGLVSGRVSLAPDTVATLPAPTSAGFWLVHNAHATAPQPPMSGIFVFDAGIHPRLDTVFLGAQMENHNTTPLDGTVSTAGNVGVSVQAGALQIENRNTYTEDFSWVFLGG